MPIVGNEASPLPSGERSISEAAGHGDAERGPGVPSPRPAEPPVPLSAALAELLELSNERDVWMERLGDEYRLGWKLGYAAGVDAGRRLEAAERDEAWNCIARPIVRGGPSHAELERRRWGPGGREHFGDPRPGDYPGCQAGAA
jgi:hypothetical protein